MHTYRSLARTLANARQLLPGSFLTTALGRAITLWIAALFSASALAGWWLISTYPALVSLIASDHMIDGVKHGHLWTDQLFGESLMRPQLAIRAAPCAGGPPSSDRCSSRGAQPPAIDPRSRISPRKLT